ILAVFLTNSSMESGREHYLCSTTQFSRDRQYLIDNKVEPDIPYGWLSSPKPAGPRSNILGEGGEQHQGLLRGQRVFSSPGEQQAPFIGFDFVFNPCPIVIQIAHMHEITIP